MGNPNCCIMIIAVAFFFSCQSPRGTVIYLYLIINVYLQTRSAKSSCDLESVHILVAFIDCGFCPHIRIKKSRWIPLVLKACIFFFFVFSVQNLSLEWNWFRTTGWVKQLKVSEYTFIFMLGRPMVSPQSQQFSQWDKIYPKARAVLA